jgi:hypothetical protein
MFRDICNSDFATQAIAINAIFAQARRTTEALLIDLICGRFI